MKKIAGQSDTDKLHHPESAKHKILGIIAEYNPFHSGHLYQIERARRESGADYVIVAMSGHFVQRGEPAIFDSYTRTRMALCSGVDAVFEIPSVFSTSSAEDFAAYAVRLLAGLGIDYISFGVEDASEKELRLLASMLLKESEGFRRRLKKLLAGGMSFPLARENALNEELCKTESASLTNARIKTLLSSPNNILALEYMKSLISINSKIRPLIIRREGNEYHSKDIQEGIYASATALRREILGRNQSRLLASALPKKVFELVQNANPVCADDFSICLYRKIKELLHRDEALDQYADVSGELADRIKNTLFLSSSYEEIIKRIKTKQYTYTRIARALSHILLEIKKEDIKLFKSHNYSLYAALLGFRSEEVLSILKRRSTLPMLSKSASAAKILPPDSYRLFMKEVFAADLYNSAYFEKHKKNLPDKFRRQIIKEV